MKQDKINKQNMERILTSIYSNDKRRLINLLDSGIDINIEDKDGRTPLIYGTIENNDELVRILIEKGSNVNKQDSNGLAPLHFAVQKYNIAIANILIENVAQIDIQDSNGNTPLSDAVFYSEGRGEIITLLLSKGANKDLKNNYGVSPFELSKTIANYNVAQFFE
mgnify:CR=1 FL=1